MKERLTAIKSFAGPTFSLVAKKKDPRGNTLCNFCGQSVVAPDSKEEGCPVYARLKRCNVASIIRTCYSFQPIILFRPKLIGLEDKFNTFRIGQEWYSHLRAGMIVSLMDSDAGHIFGRAKVVEVFTGTFDEMCSRHAYANHQMLGMEPSLAAKRLEEIMVKSYGQIVKSQHDTLKTTVVYLQRLPNAKDNQDRAA